MELPIKYNQADWKTRRRARLAYIEKQDGKCSFCDCPLDGRPAPDIEAAEIDLSLFPEGFLDNPIHLHHDHFTDLTIGAVHARCNAYLWEYLGE